MNGSRKECMGSMWEKRKVLTGIELGSGLQKEIWKDVLRPWYVVPRNQLWEQIRWFHINHTAESPLCRIYRSKGETVAHVVGEYSISCHRQNIKEGMIILRGIFIGNFVVNEDWKELVTGMNRSLREWWKVKTPKYCRISLSSATGTARQEDQTLSLLIKRRERSS